MSMLASSHVVFDVVIVLHCPSLSCVIIVDTIVNMNIVNEVSKFENLVEVKFENVGESFLVHSRV